MFAEDDFNFEDFVDNAARNVRKNLKKEESQEKSEKKSGEQPEKGPRMIKSKDGKSGIIACRTPEEAIEAIKKYGVPDDVMTIGDILNRILKGSEEYELTEEEDKELESLMKPLQKFCDKHKLPAMVLVQHGKSGTSVGMKGFRNAEEGRMELRMRFMMRLKDLIYNDACCAEDMEDIAEIFNRIYERQEKRHG